MLPFRIMYPHIGFLVGLFRLCGFCSAPPRFKLSGLTCTFYA